ncbi:MAG: amidohydrolase family protein [Gemmatimonadetes bacterium]|nr:amidohydrolase family protein [Gemmatimonadota bacterium]
MSIEAPRGGCADPRERGLLLAPEFPDAYRHVMRAIRVAAAVLTAGLSAALPLGAQTTAFVGATLWDGTGAPAVQHATLVVQDGRVVSVGTAPAPEGSTVVDVSGRWLIPGLVNAHAHVTGYWARDEITDTLARIEGDLLLYARYGVTTVNSLGDEPSQAKWARDVQDTPTLTRARLHFAGPVITATTPEDAVAAVDANADFGVDWIKIRVDDNLGTVQKLPWPVVIAVIKEAHARGLRVATHLFYLDDATRLLRMGSDLVAHSVRDADVDGELVSLLKERDVCYVPTLVREESTFVYGRRPPFFDDSFFVKYAKATEAARLSNPTFMRRTATSPDGTRYRAALAQAQKNLKALEDAGVRIAMGTDSGPAGRFPGYFEHRELQLMVDAGLSPGQALMSATSVAASCLRLDDVGTLTADRWADFLVLRSDPLADVANTRSLDAVYVAGNQVR